MFRIFKLFSIKTIVISLLFYLLIAFVIYKYTPKPKEVEFYKYTISVGSASLNYGYETNSYKDSLGYILFCKKDGTKWIYPKEKIFSINQKK